MDIDEIANQLFSDLPEFSEHAMTALQERRMSHECQASPASVSSTITSSPPAAALPRTGSSPWARIDEESDASGALRRCEARMDRLDRLNAALEAFGKEDWSLSDNRAALERRLHSNRFADAIRARLRALRARSRPCPGVPGPVFGPAPRALRPPLGAGSTRPGADRLEFRIRIPADAWTRISSNRTRCLRSRRAPSSGATRCGDGLTCAQPAGAQDSGFGGAGPVPVRVSFSRSYRASSRASG